MLMLIHRGPRGGAAVTLLDVLPAKKVAHSDRWRPALSQVRRWRAANLRDGAG